MWVDHGRRVGDFGLAAETDTVDRAEGHEQRPAVAEADDLARQAGAVAADDLATPAHGKAFRHAADLEQHAENRSDAAVTALLGDLREIADEALQGQDGSRGLNLRASMPISCLEALNVGLSLAVL